MRPISPGARELVAGTDQSGGRGAELSVPPDDVGPGRGQIGVESPGDGQLVDLDADNALEGGRTNGSLEERSDPADGAGCEPGASVDRAHGGREAVTNGGELRHGGLPSVAEGGGATDDIGSPNYVFI